MFENSVLRGIFVAKGEEVTGEWRKLHNEELNVLYCSPSFVRVTKLRIIRLFALVASIGERTVALGVWWGIIRLVIHIVFLN